MNDELAEIVEREMKRGKYGSKSEFFRSLIRKVYLEQEKEMLNKENEELVASIAKKIAKEDKSKYPTLAEALAQS